MLNNRHPRRRSGNRRRGSLSVELMLVFPILFAILLATVEFSLLSVARQQVLSASREGARVASLGGGQAEVEAAVRHYLGSGALAHADIQSALTDDRGNAICSGESVEVVVSVPATQAVPDLLAFIGVSLGKEIVVGRTVMRKE